MKIADFSFELPDDLIAYYPLDSRHEARMMVVPSSSVDIQDSNVESILAYLKQGDVLVFNDTKVIPSRFSGKVGTAKAEVTLHKKLSDSVWYAFVKPARKFNIGDYFVVADDFKAKILSKEQGEVLLDFECNESHFFEMMYQYGIIPLPPYIKRTADSFDNDRYQTIYAKNPGAVAAPTAGLHFSEDLLSNLKSKSILTAYVTLHVGAGTFLPVKVDDVDDHIMHEEYCIIDQATCDLINMARSNGGRVVSVGTTSLRLLESVADEQGILKPFSGNTSIFIKPGYSFKIVDILFTNFHLPESTLFMLVCAFAGVNKMKQAYQHAIDNKYRFYSYGDSCLLFKGDGDC